MKWRYGIVKYRNPHNKDMRFYGVGELYFMDDPLKVFACTQEPTEVYADVDEDTEEEVLANIKRQLEMMQKDISQFPIFDADGPFEKYPIDESMEEWVEFDKEKFSNEEYAGHVDEVGLAEYIKSIQEEEQGE